jgi:DNA-binding NarL/FixJ family response regulator
VTSKIQSGAGGQEHRLTARQRMVVSAVVEGYTNREIAERCGLSMHTVKNHLTRAFLKLGVRNRLQLAMCLVGNRPSERRRQ